MGSLQDDKLFIVGSWIWATNRDYSVYYLLIGGMSCLDCQNKVPMVGALVCMVINWIRTKDES